MASSAGEQLEQLVESLRPAHRAYICDGDRSTAMAWDDESEITVRLSLRGDELWVLAGSGLLARYVVPSDGEFDLETIAEVVDGILTGGAVEFFGPASVGGSGGRVATGFRVGPGSVSSGVDTEQAAFSARLAGPMARAEPTDTP